jgi:hypothetical protein
MKYLVVLLTGLMIVSCNKTAKVEIVDSEVTPQYTSSSYYHWVQPIITGAVTNLGNKIAFKVLINVELKRSDNPDSEYYSGYIDSINLEPNASSHFKINGEKRAWEGVPPTFTIQEISVTYE